MMYSEVYKIDYIIKINEISVLIVILKINCLYLFISVRIPNNRWSLTAHQIYIYKTYKKKKLTELFFFRPGHFEITPKNLIISSHAMPHDIFLIDIIVVSFLIKKCNNFIDNLINIDSIEF
jgi:hypothetical protein